MSAEGLQGQGAPNYAAAGLLAALAAGTVPIAVTTVTLVEQAAPAVSASGQALIYADSTTHSLQVSENGGAFSPISGTLNAFTIYNQYNAGNSLGAI